MSIAAAPLRAFSAARLAHYGIVQYRLMIAAPKVKALDSAKVAVTIDENSFPYKVLLIRGTAKCG